MSHDDVPSSDFDAPPSDVESPSGVDTPGLDTAGALADALPPPQDLTTLAPPEAPPGPPQRRERWYDRRGPIARFNRWADADWPVERTVRVITSFVILAGCTVIMTRIVHLDLIWRRSTPTGGDMGAHVLAPAELRDTFLPSFQLSGWSNGWYAGFPLYRFYMVIPALMIVILNVILPYGVAFKIVTVLGLLTLPWCCWAFGRLARFAYPIPELMALAGLAFMLDEKFYLNGGNVKSTMAGEFSFSIALSFAMIGLGFLARGLETGKYRGRASVLLALAMLSHGLVMLFVILAAVIMVVVWIDRQRLKYGLQVIAAMSLLSAFWTVPFVLNHAYMTDMKYEAYTGYRTAIAAYFQWSSWLMWIMMLLCIAGFVISIFRHQLHGVALGLILAALFLGYWLAEKSLPIIGLLWNPRVLPFLYLVRLLLTMVGLVEVVRLAVRLWRRRPVLTTKETWIAGVAVAAVVTIFVGVGEAVSYRVYPFASEADGVYRFGIPGWYPFHLKAPNQGKARAERAGADGWTAYNFKGYEALGHWGEYRAIMLKLRELGADPAHGCGRLEWEHQPDGFDLYGTSMALMLTGFWTNGCINSMEGVYFEASGTTPYHFITAAAISKKASNPVRGLSYDNLRLDLGAQYMRSLGVRYVMVFMHETKAAADREPSLKLVADVGPWKIYEIPDTQLAEGLKVQPVVVNERDMDRREDFLEVGVSWLQKNDRWAAIPAFEGPAEWQRVDVAPDPNDARAKDPRNAVWVYPRQEIEPQALAPVTVSNFHLGKQDMSFDVDRIGVPVLVRASYFPNWTAEGAQGPFHAGANQMIVIPTSTHVSLSFDRSTIDYLAYLLTLLGIGLLIWLWRRGDVPMPASPLPVETVPDGSLPPRFAPPAPLGAPPPGGFDVLGAPPPPPPPPPPPGYGPPAWSPVGFDAVPPSPVPPIPVPPIDGAPATAPAGLPAQGAPWPSSGIVDRDPTPIWTEPAWNLDAEADAVDDGAADSPPPETGHRPEAADGDGSDPPEQR